MQARPISGQIFLTCMWLICSHTGALSAGEMPSGSTPSSGGDSVMYAETASELRSESPMLQIAKTWERGEGGVIVSEYSHRSLPISRLD